MDAAAPSPRLALGHVTLRDIARLAGTSTGSVSRALNGQPGLSDALRQRVLQAARTLGHAGPHTERAGPRRLLFILNRYHRGALRNPFYSRVLQGAETACRERQASLSLLMLGPTDPVHELVPCHVPEALIVVGYMEPAVMSQLCSLGLPMVVVDHQVGGLPCVNDDNLAGALAATRHLLAQGRQRIAFLGGPPAHHSVGLRLRGYRKALFEAGRLADPDLEHCLDGASYSNDALWWAVLDAWQARPQPPDALFAYNDETALCALRWAQARGLRVPQDLAIVGYDDIQDAEAAGLSTVRVDKQALGACAVNTLLQPDADNAPALLPVLLVPRASTGSP